MLNPPPILVKIDKAMRAGETDRAASLACRALDSGHADPVLFSLRSHWHERSGRLEAAVADLERALALSVHPRTLASLGRCLSGLGRFEEALQRLDQALALDSDLAVAHYEKGLVLEQTGEFRRAAQSYQQALALDPASADAAAHLANLAARRSDWDQASRLADVALALDAHNPTAQFALITRDMARGDAASAEQRARQVIAQHTEPRVNAHALNALGDALDAQGHTDEAFAAYAGSKDAIREIFRGWFAHGETGLGFATRMRAGLDAMAPILQVPSLPGGPVFLLGFARAGTTLLGQILASHPQFHILEEKSLLADSVQAILAAQNGFAALMTMHEAQLEPYRTLFWQRVREQDGDVAGRIVVDQTPLNTLNLALIARLFPGARIILALRDPRDVVLSCFRRLFAPNANTWEFSSLENTARFYDAAMDCAVLARQKLPLHIHEIRNESLVADFDGEVRRLCAFLDVPFDAGMAQFAERSKTRAVATPSSTQVAKGLNSDGIGQWRRYATHMQSTLPLLQRWVAVLGYPP